MTKTQFQGTGAFNSSSDDDEGGSHGHDGAAHGGVARPDGAPADPGPPKDSLPLADGPDPNPAAAPGPAQAAVRQSLASAAADDDSMPTVRFQEPPTTETTLAAPSLTLENSMQNTDILRAAFAMTAQNRGPMLGIPATEADKEQEAEEEAAKARVQLEDLTWRDFIFFLFDGFPAHLTRRSVMHWVRAADVYMNFMFFVVLVSCFSFSAETLPEYYDRDLTSFTVIEAICIAFFTVDFVVRLVLTRERVEFLHSVHNWIDFVSIAPYYVGLFVADAQSATALVMFRMLRLMRVLRILKLSKKNIGLQAVVEAMLQSREAISLLSLLLLIATVLFSSAVYFAEQTDETFDSEREVWIYSDGTESAFQSIPHSMWWCIVTMTTVGYGDDVPRSALGKVVGAVTMLIGVFVLAFPTVILSTNFQEVHQAKLDEQHQIKNELEQEEEEEEDAMADKKLRSFHDSAKDGNPLLADNGDNSRRTSKDDPKAAETAEALSDEAPKDDSPKDSPKDDTEGGPSDDASRRERRQSLQDAARRLPQRQRSRILSAVLGDDSATLQGALESRQALRELNDRLANTYDRYTQFTYKFNPYPDREPAPRENPRRAKSGRLGVVSFAGASMMRMMRSPAPDAAALPTGAANPDRLMAQERTPDPFASPQPDADRPHGTPPSPAQPSAVESHASFRQQSGFASLRRRVTKTFMDVAAMPTAESTVGLAKTVEGAVLVVGDGIAVYHPALYFEANEQQNLLARVEHVAAVGKEVVTLFLVVDIDTCRIAVDEALRARRPEAPFQLVPRIVKHLKLRLECDHPLLSDIRLMTSAYDTPMGTLPVSLLLPNQTALACLMTNLGQLRFQARLFFDDPVAVEEPLVRYGGVLLSGDAFDDEAEMRYAVLQEQHRQRRARHHPAAMAGAQADEPEPAPESVASKQRPELVGLGRYLDTRRGTNAIRPIAAAEATGASFASAPPPAPWLRQRGSSSTLSTSQQSGGATGAQMGSGIGIAIPGGSSAASPVPPSPNLSGASTPRGTPKGSPKGTALPPKKKGPAVTLLGDPTALLGTVPSSSQMTRTASLVSDMSGPGMHPETAVPDDETSPSPDHAPLVAPPPLMAASSTTPPLTLSSAPSTTTPHTSATGRDTSAVPAGAIPPVVVTNNTPPGVEAFMCEISGPDSCPLEAPLQAPLEAANAPALGRVESSVAPPADAAEPSAPAHFDDE